MKHKLATIPVVVAALTVSALAVHTTGSPAGAAPKPSPTPPPAPTWRIEDYGPRTSDNAILLWNQQLLDSIKANPGGTGPTRAARFLGILHTVDLRRVGGVRRRGEGHPARLPAPPASRSSARPANKIKAISYAAHRTLVALFPARKSFYDAQLAAQNLPPSESMDRTTPEGVGNTAAQAVLDFRSTDGSATPKPLHRGQHLGHRQRPVALAAAVRADRRRRGREHAHEAGRRQLCRAELLDPGGPDARSGAT